MKKALKMAALMLCAAAMMTACNCNTSCNSDENKMAQFEKKATEFKAALDPSNKVIAERMDTVVQKVFYLDPNQDFEGVNPIKNIMMHDYATDKTQAILPDTEKINDYLLYGELVDNEEESFNHCFNLDYRSSELFGDRLFMMIHTECSFDTETSLLFYVNVLDNSLHFVTDCDDVKYDKANGTIEIHKELMKAAGADLEHNITITTTATDKEYAAMRDENEEIENQMIEKWREENED
jgi:hypothetical protein